MPLTRRLILQKARCHPNKEAPTVCKQTVSGTISLPSRGTFHHSLTVLVRYRSPGSIQPYQVVLADSRQITGVRRYSGTPKRGLQLSSTGLSPSTARHSHRFDYRPALTRPGRQTRDDTPHDPDDATPAGYHTPSVWPLPRSLATTDGITVVFSSCGY